MSTHSPLLFLKVCCAIHWGWKLNVVPFSKSRPPLKVPPPTTLIGALAYPLNRMLKASEGFGECSGAERLRSMLSYVGLRLASPSISYFDLSKISFFYRRARRTDAVAVGKTYSLISGREEGELPEITICYVIDKERAIGTFGDGAKEKLIAATCGITRIGSRESTAAPLSVSYGDAKLLTEKRGETTFSFTTRSANPINGNYITINDVVDWEQASIGDYTKAQRTSLIVPYDERTYTSSPVTVEASDGYVLVDAGGDTIVARWPMR